MGIFKQFQFNAKLMTVQVCTDSKIVHLAREFDSVGVEVSSFSQKILKAKCHYTKILV